MQKECWQKEYKKKYLPPEQFESFRDKISKEKKTLVTLNGSFDLLHAGHLHILFEASKQGDTLLVALNSDQSIQKYKSTDRPIIPLKYRLQMIAAIEFVDFVTYFDETDPRAFLEKVQPDVHTNATEYGPQCIEAETVRKYGGKLFLIDRVDNLSTSEIINRIQKA